MAGVITHSVSAGGTVDATADVDGAAWDANHVITGAFTPSQGGTGVANNDSSTLTISGSFGITFTVSATTSLTLPTTGTLATVAGSETLTNKTINLASNTLTGTTAEFNTALSDNDFATLAGSEALTNKTYNGNTWTAGTGTLTLGAGKTATVGNTLTFTGTDGSTAAFGAGGTVAYQGGSLAQFAATTSAELRGVLSDESGTGAAYFQGGDLGTPSAGVLTNATGLPISTGVAGLGTGIATALAVNTGSAGAPVLFNGALGTPSSGTLTNATGLPVSTGISGLGTGVATFLATPSSANLASAVTGETGSGALVFGTNPTIDGAVVTGVVDAGGATSFEIPNDTAPTVNADGEIAVDTSVTDFSHGIIKYYGGEELGVVAMPIAQFTTPTNGAVPTYNSTTDEFELAVAAGGGDLLAANNLSDVASAATSFANIKQAASDTATGVLEIAVQSEMETGTDTTRAVVPGRQQYHPSAAKAWAKVTQSGTMALDASYNMGSVTDAGTGNSQFNLTTSFSSANYGGGAIGQQGTNNTEIFAGFYSPATGSFRALNNDTSGTPRDTVGFVTANGDQ